MMGSRTFSDNLQKYRNFTKISEFVNKEGNKFNCTVIFNDETFKASAALKKEAEQKVSELILLRVNQL